MRILAISLSFSFLLVACSSGRPQGVDQKKFESLLLTGKDVQADLDSGQPPRKELLRRLKAEAATAENLVVNDAEKSMVQFYADAASALLFSETSRETEMAAGTPSQSDDAKASVRFRKIGIEKLKAAQQACQPR